MCDTSFKVQVCVISPYSTVLIVEQLHNLLESTRDTKTSDDVGFPGVVVMYQVEGKGRGEGFLYKVGDWGFQL